MNHCDATREATALAVFDPFVNVVSIADRTCGLGGRQSDPIDYSASVVVAMLALFHGALGALGGLIAGFVFEHAWRGCKATSDYRDGSEHDAS